LIVCVPAPADGVYVTVQFDVVEPGLSVQGLPEKPPVPELEKLTVPAGADFVP